MKKHVFVPTSRGHSKYKPFQEIPHDVGASHCCFCGVDYREIKQDTCAQPIGEKL